MDFNLVSIVARFDVMAYDFLYDADNQPAISEISYTFGAAHGSKISECPGYWDDQLTWHNQLIDSAYFILSQIINTSSLKQP